MRVNGSLPDLGYTVFHIKLNVFSPNGMSVFSL